MNRRVVRLVLVAALVAVAGCTGGIGGDIGTDGSTDGSSSEGTGTAAFYVSDEPNAIDDFEHLNVTITTVGFKRTGDVSDGDANETADGNDGDGSDERWIEYDVDERTVDLTELKGANASVVDEFELPAGDYEKVFIYVSDTEGVLADGSTTRVKLPSNKLQINSKFTIGDGERVDFVYDIAPHKAGNSGKYILKPVISQSGTGDDVEIRNVDQEKGDEEGDKQRGNGNAGEK
ncbi:DUF4382 domain-containing protein [Natrinema sp. SYSU A 869]|uniref:DUF4382 domain-containing protein n=1 Tax=Natrinema sp. SYSU A 869 TaxID=2871694 RepID=UPI001CA419CB|nr:DUF4382 domain-containing protein [Natrinema sp. SYSU A 869]